MNKIPPISSEVLENLSRVIGDTTTGLTGTEIGYILADSLIPDVTPLMTKWKRLFNAFAEIQNKTQCSNNILTFIQKAMQPVRYIAKNEIFEFRLAELNKRLAFIGYELTKEAKYRKIEKTTTIQNITVEKQEKDNQEYHLAISFAGEDRKIAEEIAERLKRFGFRVFYDKYEQATLWGKDLYAHLTDVYKKKANYCLMIISKNYAEKQWTNLERKAAQARAFTQSKEYILPLKLDDTEIPGINETIGYVDYRKVSLDEIVELLKFKLNE
ncbi:TIR domain-containing protein [Mariniphaga anaerophila]|uniref:TIR domain-containing protein n=1 Tax=Mariniphaga anaerophila TaxID=1484053 RepID=A0A1M5GMZ4_9BACT|nr:TIR domain-containing protein [Mariniphaga anaerophila]SHG05066.1 TIR domain-containing protein [Mariniphaga anaerophila]